MNWRKILKSSIFPLLIVFNATMLSRPGGWHLLWLVLLLVAVGDVYRTFRPAPPKPVPAELTEPGEYRVVLQLTGRRKIHVIKEIRVASALDLRAAKELAEQAPAVVVEKISRASADAIVERLRGAGAKAVATPMEDLSMEIPMDDLA